MSLYNRAGLQEFNNKVAVKFQLYNSLFSALPFHKIEKTGILLSVFQSMCEEGYQQQQSPTEITEKFFEKNTTYQQEQDKLDMLFRMIQYVERQVVLFDALEDAAFTAVTDTGGAGTLKQLELEIFQQKKEEELAQRLKEFSLQLVLTAHPTQFYPGPVLGIINDLSKSLGENETAKINIFLQQLGKTPFLNKKKPTPFDEAVSLIWYLENVFYKAAGRIATTLASQYPNAFDVEKPVLNMGFWPGGDRDGNPFVTAETTANVASALRGAIIKCYYLETRRLRRRLTFEGIDTILINLEKQLYENIFIPGYRTELSKENIIGELKKVKDMLIYKHNSLFLHLVTAFISKVNIFGLHFASLDVRQESSIHNLVLESLYGAKYQAMPPMEKIDFLTEQKETSRHTETEDGIISDTLLNIQGIKNIQEQNGEEGCNRYIISQCGSALNIIEVYGLFLACGWPEENLTIDIVPLFETIEDLKNAAGVMSELYKNKAYREHLMRRKKRQTIMLGFSDGTKDGGYLMANFSIYNAKIALTEISKHHGIDVIFFDGRGGPPSRGGGKTHRFYASMGQDISNKEIQLTIQGQTISSNFGNVAAAQYNIEQLIHAGLSNAIFSPRQITLKASEHQLLATLAEKSFSAYLYLKNHPDFLEYMMHVSPVKFYAQTNIASRPGKRNPGNKLVLKDLRAIPFVGAWAQIKQNVTGYFGVGTALAAFDKEGNLPLVKDLYRNSLFFKTLIDNCEMVLKKCFFPLTGYLKNDSKFGELWNIIFEEFELTKKYILQLSGQTMLMEEYPVDSLSIVMREKIILPSLTIQQYAINKIREMDEQFHDSPLRATYEKLVIRSSFGIINAGRNAV